MERLTDILVIDDDVAVCAALRLVLKRAGYNPLITSSPDEALAVVRGHGTKGRPEVILMDMNFSLSTSGREGLDLLRKMRVFTACPIILMTAWASVPLAVEGMRLGAFDFIGKPWDNTRLLQTIDTALRLSERTTAPAGEDTARRKSTLSAQACRGEDPCAHIVGRSDAIERVKEQIRRIAPTHASVLITGESGTGKELIAEALHRGSKRASAPFVKVNLGGVPESLFESELFGHKKGAFTGAFADRKGRFDMADGGTIFLDEIGELPTANQVKLLRVLQEQTFEPLGESVPHRVDVRVVSATNAPLKKMVAEGRFREDLYYRINLIHLHLPPLRERCEDIPLLVNAFSEAFSASAGLPPATWSPEAMNRICAMPLPGNVRELKNVVERTLLLSNASVVRGQDVADFGVQTTEDFCVAEKALTEVEEEAIREALRKHDGNVSRAARALGLSRAALYRRMEKYGL
ncbi:sigma-54-dependent transcriptional regulator [Porphyromonas loveana]|uniref:sigma-54-dependent transcriptional regulator n=1 Tax=Porphyromonas loveana TaxID=1884669 RepID=UPI00359F77BA